MKFPPITYLPSALLLLWGSLNGAVYQDVIWSGAPPTSITSQVVGGVGSTMAMAILIQLFTRGTFTGAVNLSGAVRESLYKRISTALVCLAGLPVCALALRDVEFAQKPYSSSLITILLVVLATTSWLVLRAVQRDLLQELSVPASQDDVPR